MDSDRVIDEAIASIYKASTNPRLWPEALDSIARCTNGVGAVLLWAREDGSFGSIASTSLKEAQNEYESGWWREDLRSQRAVERSFWLSGDVVTDEDGITPAEMETHPFYTQFLAKFGLRWVAAVGVAPDPRLHAGLTVQRGVDRAPFTADEKELVTRLGRHVEQALRIGVQLIEANVTSATLGLTLRRMGVATFTLDESDRVLFHNGLADKLLSGQLSLRDGKLRVQTGSGAHVSLDRAFLSQRSLSSTTSDTAPLLLRNENGRHLIAFRIPVYTSSDIAEEFLRNARKLLLVVERNEGQPTDIYTLRELFGLTGAEAKLASLIGRGISPKAAAKQLQITEGTVRTVLKRIYSKMDVSRQSELAALLGQIGLMVR
jgi:DNA-binding CsgD family transcriptional regulator